MEDLKQVVLKSIDKGGEVMPTIAEKWIQEGEQKGIKKGREKGREEEKDDVARRSIQKEMTDADIRDITGLSIQKIQLLRKQLKAGSSTGA
jgi:predicted transposase/invertase (TIGR01784 family)